MRAAGVEPDAAVSVGAGAGVGVRTPLVAALACEPRLWLQGAGAEGDRCARRWRTGARCAGWAYTTLRWPFQPGPILPGVEAPGGQRHLEEQLADPRWMDGAGRAGSCCCFLCPGAARASRQDGGSRWNAGWPGAGTGAG